MAELRNRADRGARQRTPAGVMGEGKELRARRRATTLVERCRGWLAMPSGGATPL